MKRTCKDCGKEFELANSEIKFYKSKGLNLPKRCKECRARNKSERAQTSDTAPQRSKAVRHVNPTRSTSYDKPVKGKKGSVLLFLIAIVLVAVVYFFFCNGDNSSDNSIADSASSGDIISSADDSLTLEENTEPLYSFRNDQLLDEHYEKHGIEMGFESAAEYEAAASAVVENPNALYKTEAEDGDGVYFLDETNEFVILSTDGYIRTYYYADGGIDYFNRQ